MRNMVFWDYGTVYLTGDNDRIRASFSSSILSCTLCRSATFSRIQYCMYLFVRFQPLQSPVIVVSSSLGEDRRRVGQHSAVVVARAAAEHAEEARRLRGGLALALGPAREVEAHLGKYHATCGPE